MRNEIAVGGSFKGWKIEEEIGEGAYGKVYRITRHEFGHGYTSALKVISIPRSEEEYDSVRRNAASDEEAVDFFKAEVDNLVEEFALMSVLRGNSNIVNYEGHEVVKKKDAFGWDIFIRMELLTPLVDVMKESPLGTDEILKLGIDICTALEVCANEEIIHRDIKPENIFVSKIGGYKLGDFGIATQAEGRNPGIPKQGTYAYMAPEICKEKAFDKTADIYSLGIVLYSLLNHGRGPHLPKYPEKLTYSDRINANVLRMSGKEMEPIDGIDDSLNEIIMKACAYEPAERYANAGEFKDALKGVLDKLSAAGSDEMRELSAGTGRRRGIKVLIPLLAAGVAAVLVGWRLYDESLYTTVPDVEGMSGDEALSALEEAELEMNIIDEKYDEEVAAGNVISQLTDGGEKVKKGDTVDVTISAGLIVEVPDLAGMTKKEAGELLESDGLVLEVVSREYSEEVEKGSVIRQIPDAGDEIHEGDTVSVVISKGSGKVEVPNVEGDHVDDAKEELKAAGLEVKVVRVYSDSVDAGHVISQDVNAGESVSIGTKVVLTVSKGSQPQVSVPTPSTDSGSSSSTSSSETTSGDDEKKKDDSAEMTMSDDKPTDGE